MTICFSAFFFLLNQRCNIIYNCRSFVIRPCESILLVIAIRVQFGFIQKGHDASHASCISLVRFMKCGVPRIAICLLL